MKKRIYLSGPITGKPIEEAALAFQNAETAVLDAGNVCYNPQWHVPAHIQQLTKDAAGWNHFGFVALKSQGLPSLECWEDCMRVALSGLLDCHEIQMLPGWRDSKGAKLEHHIALALGMPVSYPEGEEPNPEPANLTDLATEFTAWSRTAFPEADWGNSLEKLSQEIDEVWEATTSESDHGIALELADCLMCVFDSAARLGINPQMLTDAFSVKLEANRKRQWQRNEDGTYSHVK